MFIKLRNFAIMKCKNIIKVFEFLYNHKATVANTASRKQCVRYFFFRKPARTSSLREIH